MPRSNEEVDVADHGEAGSTARKEQARQKTYAEYLELPQLLSLQRPLAQPPVHDEMLFVIVHQAHELWFKQMLLELRVLIEQIDARAWSGAEHTTDRLSAIVGLLICHVDVLKTMPVEEFQRFRAVLGSASGMQSEQFKAIEELAAGGAAEEPVTRKRPQSARSVSASVREAFANVTGADIPANDRTFMSASDVHQSALFCDPAWSRERRLAERLLHFDAEMVRWRMRHAELARAMIGNAAGTGGSAGARYLQGTLDKRFFPELWTAQLEAT